MAKIVFMGSPAFAVPSLRALHAAGHEIVAVYSQPPRPAGRGQKLQKTAVHEVAEELGLEVFTPEKLKGADLDYVMGLDADVFCVVAYGLLLPKLMVDNRLCLNVHPSALPRWRGAAPLQWTLISGDTTTDVCIMRLDAGMDTGPVIARETLTIDDTWSLCELHDVCAQHGAAMLVDVVKHLDEREEEPQEGNATHAPKITKEIRTVDWTQSAEDVRNLVRGLSPSPAAVSELGGESFKILRADVVAMWAHKVIGEAGVLLGVDAQGIMVACGTGALRIVEMQRAGGKPATAADVARGWVDMKAGARLG